MKYLLDNILGPRFLLATCLIATLGIIEVGFAKSTDPVNPLLREYPILVDPTFLDPPTWWHVPGVTPLLWTKDPMTYEAYRSTESREIKLKPGEYRFGTFTFDFAFRVTLDGQLEFDPSLGQCVKGQGTNTLVIRCSHTQPYKQNPDY
jgi:hypothetical protein